jgi:hypothetical protein
MSKLQNQDFKTEAELVAAGSSAASLLNDDKIYVTANGINKTLEQAIVDNDIGGGGGTVDGSGTANRVAYWVDTDTLTFSSVMDTELGYLSGVSSAIQTQINGKEPTITGAATTITGSNLTVNRALTSNASGKVAVSAVTSTELGYLSGVSSAIQTQINGKEPTITGAATTITSSDLTVSRALESNGSGKVAVSSVTSTELGYVSGVTSAIQTQINNKADLASPAFTGAPTAPTPIDYDPATTSTQISNVSHVLGLNGWDIINVSGGFISDFPITSIKSNLVLFGTLTTDITLRVPSTLTTPNSAFSWVIVNNATMGSFTITIAPPLGSTGTTVDIPSGFVGKVCGSFLPAIFPNPPGVNVSLVGGGGGGGSPVDTEIIGTNIDWSTGDTFYKEISTSSFFTFSNEENGKTILVILKNTGASNITITFPSALKSGTLYNIVSPLKENIYTFVRSNNKTYVTAVSDFE